MNWEVSPYSYSLERLWYAVLVLSVVLPFIFGHFWRRKWKFTVRGLLVSMLLIAVSLVWLKDDLMNLVLVDLQQSAQIGHAATSNGELLTHPDGTYLFVALGLSMIFAWGVYAKPSDQEV